jgi:hypothetical protein
VRCGGAPLKIHPVTGFSQGAAQSISFGERQKKGPVENRARLLNFAVMRRLFLVGLALLGTAVSVASPPDFAALGAAIAFTHRIPPDAYVRISSYCQVYKIRFASIVNKPIHGG